MSSEFNFVRAQREWAYPRWLELSDAIKALYVRVQRECAGLSQNHSLGMDWPADGSLKAAFDAIPNDELIEAQDVIYYLGHWDAKENKDLQFPRDKCGGYWKFQKYARQSLVERPNRMTDKWPEFDCEPWMDHVEGTEYSDSELPKLLGPKMAAHFKLVKVTRINHRLSSGCALKGNNDRHPFCIGTPHFPKDDGMYIQPKQAPCCICGRDYDDHISDKVMVIKPLRANVDKLNDEEAATLKAMEPDMVTYKIDGFVFTK